MAQEKSRGTILEIAGLAAQIILENGAETYRVEDTVLRLCRAYGCMDAEVIALSTGVLISASIEGDNQSTIRRVRKRNMNLSRVNEVNDLSRRIAAGDVPMDEALPLLREIARSKTPGTLPLSLMAGFSAASFALMFGGGVTEMLTALLCGIATQWAILGIRPADMSLVLVSLVGGLVCSGVTMGAFYLLRLTPASVEIILSGAIMPLISGLMMTNAVRDSLRGDLLSGMARSMEALLVAIMVALGVSLLLQFYVEVVPDGLPSVPWYLGVVYAGLATMFFCPQLNVPRRAVAPASLLGAAAYGVFSLMWQGLGALESVALFVAAGLVAILCDLLARRMGMIATIFLCAALIPLVPGLGLYRTMRALLLGDIVPALMTGMQTLFSVGAIALGAALGSLGILRRPERRK